VKPAEDVILGAARVLVVDDVSTNVALLDRVLRNAGVGTVAGFTNPQHALADCERERPDLILLDMHMPGLDGVGFLRALAASLDADEFVPVIVLTADATDESRHAALTAGAKDFLTKPFDRIEVVLRVRNLLETGSLYARLREHSAALQSELDSERARTRESDTVLREQTDRIDAALAPGGMTMVYQPFVSLADNHIVGAEALARFVGPPLRPPNEWFDEAARVGRLDLLELSAVALALSRLEQLPDGAFMSVNVSPSTSSAPHLGTLLDTLPAERIVVELTEHTKVADYDQLAAALAPFVARGGRVAVDDAGAGYAGLQHLLRLRPDIVKLDIALTTGVDRDPARRALADGLVRFAEEIGATLIAEGIETAAEYAVLRDLGVDWGQGYYIARPAPLPLTLDADSARSVQAAPRPVVAAASPI
jgi:EAL domain-containing protein (putative c-di-GMP-specific phosphodiesterase class I)/AmiR/NasT family two-component response regulator